MKRTCTYWQLSHLFDKWCVHLLRYHKSHLYTLHSHALPPHLETLTWTISLLYFLNGHGQYICKMLVCCAALIGDKCCRTTLKAETSFDTEQEKKAPENVLWQIEQRDRCRRKETGMCKENEKLLGAAHYIQNDAARLKARANVSAIEVPKGKNKSIWELQHLAENPNPVISWDPNHVIGRSLTHDYDYCLFICCCIWSDLSKNSGVNRWCPD